ncbi:Hint domain-containing protein [Roseovarius sp. D0-M9]|uniref:Hint domain-containing protein n=1 Tax=Roseovarius sp. D0-M9 TaxID=3127117 RepID=UPI00300FD7AE
MANVEIFVTGDEVGTFSSVSTSGNSNGTKVILEGVEPLGTSSDIFRVVIRQVNEGDNLFSNGQFVDIYAHPDSDPPAPPLYSNLNPQHDQFQGRASSGDHQIITGSENIVFDVNGLTAGTIQYGPGNDPPREAQLSFETFSPEPPVFPCFAAGTLIETETGPLPIEVIRAGDLVHTLDHGLQPVHWSGQREVVGRGSMAPIEISAGALGNPRRLVVSPQHRMLIEGWRAEMYFGQAQVLSAAVHLINGDTIRQVPRRRVCYGHLAFEQHEVIFAEGIPSESLYLGEVALDALSADQRTEIEAIFPELTASPNVMSGAAHSTARRCLRRWEAKLVA